MDSIISALRNDHFIGVARELNRIIAAGQAECFDPAQTRRRLQATLLGSMAAAQTAASFLQEGEGGLQLLSGKTDKARLYSDRPLRLRLSWPELNCLYFALRSGRMSLWMEPSLCRLLQRRLERYAEQMGRQFYDHRQHLEPQGLPNRGDDCASPALKEKLAVVRSAAAQRRALRYGYPTAQGEQRVWGVPRALAYSPLDETLWLLLDTAQGKRRARIASMSDITVIEIPAEGIEKDQQPLRALELLVSDKWNAPERVVSRFGGYDREISYDAGQEQPYRIVIRYPALDEQRVLLRLRSFGSGVRVVTASMAAQLQADANAALTLYGE